MFDLSDARDCRAYIAEMEMAGARILPDGEHYLDLSPERAQYFAKLYFEAYFQSLAFVQKVNAETLQ